VTTLKSVRDSIIRQVLYSVASAVLVWLLACAIVIYRDHFMGFHAAHIAWLAAQPDSWSVTMHHALHVAGIWAVIALGAGLALIVVANLISGIIALLGIAIAKNSRGGI
jgi:hypothetical protein